MSFLSITSLVTKFQSHFNTHVIIAHSFLLVVSIAMAPEHSEIMIQLNDLHQGLT